MTLVTFLRDTTLEAIKKKAAPLKGMVDSVNITDNQTAVVRMASWAAALIAIEEGLELERAQLWGDAVRHYETASRKHPESITLYQRLIISRLHFDVNRRYQDESFMASVRQMSTDGGRRGRWRRALAMVPRGHDAAN